MVSIMGGGLPSPPPADHFHQNSPLWPVCLGRPYMHGPYCHWVMPAPLPRRGRGITLMTRSIQSRLWCSQWSGRLWEPGFKEGRVPNNWCLQTVVLKKTRKSPLDCKEIKLVDLKGNQPRVLTGRTDAEPEAPVFWSPAVNSWLTVKLPDAGKDWRQKDKRVSEDEVVGWHHWCNGHELGQTSGDGEGQGSLVCCSAWGCKESDMTERLNNHNIGNF